MAKSKFLAKKIKKSVLNRIIDFFVHSNYHAYLAGGYIRDSTLGRESVDIDVVVEGNAIKVAEELNQKLQARLNTHKEFGTASIITTIERIDLASARIEKYPSPAKLPRVSFSTIREDLNRRDFTMNAIAMSISKENFGEIFDPFNGLADIKKKIVKVLHNKSFIDDPTRIFRALRYKNRFNFKLDKETEKLLMDAVSKNLINHLTGQRILNEIKLIFDEESYLKTIQDVSKYKILEIANSDLKLLPLLGSIKVYGYLAKFNAKKFPLKKEENKIINEIRQLKTITTNLSRAPENSTIYNILFPISQAVIEIIPSLRPDLKEKVKKYFSLKNIEPLVTGKDLKKMGMKPGPKFKNLLKKVFELQLDKKINTKKEALGLLKDVG